MAAAQHVEHKRSHLETKERREREYDKEKNQGEDIAEMETRIAER